MTNLNRGDPRGRRQRTDGRQVNHGSQPAREQALALRAAIDKAPTTTDEDEDRPFSPPPLAPTNDEPLDTVLVRSFDLQVQPMTDLDPSVTTSPVMVNTRDNNH